MSVLIVREILKREQSFPGLGARIKQAQKDSGLSVKKVIQGLELSRTYWNNLVKDETMILSIVLLRKIEKFFNVDFGVKFDDQPDAGAKPND